MGLLKRRIRRMARQKIKKPAREAIRGAASRWCPECEKRVPPFHTCEISTDFRQRRRAEQRANTQSRRQARAAKGGRAARQPREPHLYQECHDPDCRRPVCVAFKQGLAACPRPHQ